MQHAGAWHLLERYGLRLHGRVDRDPLEVLGAQRTCLVRHRRPRPKAAPAFAEALAPKAQARAAAIVSGSRSPAGRSRCRAARSHRRSHLAGARTSSCFMFMIRPTAPGTVHSIPSSFASSAASHRRITTRSEIRKTNVQGWETPTSQLLQSQMARTGKSQTPAKSLRALFTGEEIGREVRRPEHGLNHPHPKVTVQSQTMPAIPGPMN